MNSLTDGVKHWTTKLSSAGLVYLHFGRRVIATITGDVCVFCAHQQEYMIYSSCYAWIQPGYYKLHILVIVIS